MSWFPLSINLCLALTIANGANNLQSQMAFPNSNGIRTGSIKHTYTLCSGSLCVYQELEDIHTNIKQQTVLLAVMEMIKKNQVMGDD